MTLPVLIDQITQWGMDRQIIQNGTAEASWLKLISEIGEMADHMAKGESIADDVGDCFVVLVMLAGIRKLDWDDVFHELSCRIVPDGQEPDIACLLTDASSFYVNHADEMDIAILVCDLEGIARHHSLDLIDCVQIAYGEIRDRKGTLMPNGVFVKEEG